MSKLYSQNINLPIVLRVIGWLLMIEGFYMVLPALVSLYYDETQTMVTFFISAAITVVTGAAMTFGLKPKNKSMRKREGLLLTAVVWVFFSAFGTIPYMLTGTFNSVTDSFFESMSGFTTTGASLIASVENLPHGIVFWRAATQWMGGMGIILFTLAVLPMLNYKGGIALFNAEVTGITHERMRPRVSQTAKDLWLIYFAMTVIMILLLYSPMGWFDAVCHSMSTVSTGGFSSKDTGVHYWHNYYVYGVVIVFMFMGGINFTILYSLIRGRFSVLRHNDTFKCYVIILVLSSVLIIIATCAHGVVDNWSDRVTYALFNSVAALTSTGFPLADYENNGEFVALLLFIMMFFGGMAGSTSGGAKIDRFLIMIKNTRNEFYRVLHSNAVTAVRIDGKALSQNVVSKVLAFLAIYVLIMMVVAIILAATGLPMFDSIYTSLSMLSNLGFGYGSTAEQGALMALPIAIKWVLALEMMVGRLELFTVLILFTRDFWLKD